MDMDQPYFELFFILIILLMPLLAIIDIVRSRFRERVNKVVWVLVVLFFPFFGTVLYFALAGRQKVRDRLESKRTSPG